MTDVELLTNEDLPTRAPDLLVVRDRYGAWRVEQLSERMAVQMGLGDLEARGLLLRELFAEVAPALDALAEEVLDSGVLKALPIRFLGEPVMTLLADVEPGGYSAKGHHRQVQFHFRPEPTGQARHHLPSGQFGLIGASPGMLDVYRKIGLYAETDAAVVITGETGTGKELVARALHDQGARRDHAFVAVNCSAISAELLESELFGHEKGAFTGAVRAHRGRFERAHLGTIFLDEIGDMPAHAQVKLLRVLEDGVLERVGSEKVLPVNVRVVGATNVPLERAVNQGRFREDLYHRLAVLRVHLPPLRQRPDDIPLLVEHFLELFQRKYRRSAVRVTGEAMALLRAYLWPGNVRELRNVLERVFIENHAEAISAKAFKEWVRERQDFSPGDWGPQRMGETSQIAPPRPLHSEQILLPGYKRQAIVAPGAEEMQLPRHSTRPADLDEAEIRRAYRLADGNLTAAARMLGVHRATLYRYLDKLGLSRSSLKS